MRTAPAPRHRTARSAARQAMAAVVPVVAVAGAVLGHPYVPAAAPGAAGMSRTRCSRACGGRCRSATRARALVL